MLKIFFSGSCLLFITIWWSGMPVWMFVVVSCGWRYFARHSWGLDECGSVSGLLCLSSLRFIASLLCKHAAQQRASGTSSLQGGFKWCWITKHTCFIVLWQASTCSRHRDYRHYTLHNDHQQERGPSHSCGRKFGLTEFHITKMTGRKEGGTTCVKSGWLSGWPSSH